MIENEKVDSEIKVAGIFGLNLEDEVVVDGKWHTELRLSLVTLDVVAVGIRMRLITCGTM